MLTISRWLTLVLQARIQDFVPLRQDFLDEFVRFDGPEHDLYEGTVTCKQCNCRPALIRCRECDRRELYCSQCIVDRHRDLALHTLQVHSIQYLMELDQANLPRAIAMGRQEVCEDVSAGSRARGTARPLRREMREAAQAYSMHFGSPRQRDTRHLCKLLRVSGRRRVLRLRMDTALPPRVVPGNDDTLQNRLYVSAARHVPRDKFPEQDQRVRPLEVNRTAYGQLWWTRLGELKLLSIHFFRAHRARYSTFYRIAIDRYPTSCESGAICNRSSVRDEPTIPMARLVRRKANSLLNARPVRIPARTSRKVGRTRPRLSSTFRSFLRSQYRASFTEYMCRWLYTLFLMMDANFRAKCKDRGLDDFELSPGWSYFVEEDKYMAHVRQQGDQTEVRVRLTPADRRLKRN